MKRHQPIVILLVRFFLCEKRENICQWKKLLSFFTVVGAKFFVICIKEFFLNASLSLTGMTLVSNLRPHDFESII